jgi:hypothetical protein
MPRVNNKSTKLKALIERERREERKEREERGERERGRERERERERELCKSLEWKLKQEPKSIQKVELKLGKHQTWKVKLKHRLC